MTTLIGLSLKKNLKTAAETVAYIAKSVKSTTYEKKAIFALPEYSNVPQIANGKKLSAAILSKTKLNSKTYLAGIAKIAKKEKVNFVVPYLEKEGVFYYSSASVITSGGKISKPYRRMHFPGDENARSNIKPGNSVCPVFSTPAGKVGILLGEDRVNFETARILGIRGAEILVSASVSQIAVGNTFNMMLRSHAVANQIFVLGLLTGKKQSSVIYDIRGNLVSKGAGTIQANVDRADIRNVRNVWQFYRDRRPETYATIVGMETDEARSEVLLTDYQTAYRSNLQTLEAE